MPCPPLAARSVNVKQVQSSTSIDFECSHYFLWTSVGLNYDVDVIHPDMCSKQLPAAMRANLMKRPQHEFPPSSVQEVWAVLHQLSFSTGSYRIRVEKATAWDIVLAIHGSQLVSVNMCAVTCKGD
jgi:hypothetical protein